MENVRILAGSIDAATHDQSLGVEEVLAAVGEVNDIAEQNTVRVGELNLVVEALTHQTGSLEGEVGLFNVGGECLRAAARSELAAKPEARTWSLAPVQQAATEPAV